MILQQMGLEESEQNAYATHGHPDAQQKPIVDDIKGEMRVPLTTKNAQ